MSKIWIIKCPNKCPCPNKGHGGVLVGPGELRQVFNDTDEEVLWLITGAPEEPEVKFGTNADLSQFYPVDPKQLPKELAGVTWPPKS